MNSKIKLLGQCCCGLALLFLAACGGGGGGETTSATSDSSSSSSASLSGHVADGYLREARVFLDRNENRRYDNGEPTAYSDAGGAYTLEVNSGEGDLYPVVVDVLAGQTVDEDNGLTITDGYQLESPKGHWQFISPLTTLVQLTQEKNPSFTQLQAIIKVRSELGIDDEVSLFEDYMANSLGGAKAVNVQTATEYQRAHKAARVVAALMGQLRSRIIQNLGGLVADGEQDALTYMISDQVEEQAPTIKQALDAERNLGETADVSTLVATTSQAIDTTELDATMVAEYAQRIAQDLPAWDMQPPGLVKETPAENDSASVAVTIKALFDEPLDETQALDNLIEVLGPRGKEFGTVSYDAEKKELDFVPDQALLPNSTYEVILKKGLADSLGNAYKSDVRWTFNTVFDQTPPPLPDF